jgi:hypothetical protein
MLHAVRPGCFIPQSLNEFGAGHNHPTSSSGPNPVRPLGEAVFRFALDAARANTAPAITAADRLLSLQQFDHDRAQRLFL